MIVAKPGQLCHPPPSRVVISVNTLQSRDILTNQILEGQEMFLWGFILNQMIVAGLGGVREGVHERGVEAAVPPLLHRLPTGQEGAQKNYKSGQYYFPPSRYSYR